MGTVIGDAPLRVRDAGRLGHVLAAALGGALGGALTIGMVVFGAGSWKGGVDARLSSLADAVNRMQFQVDRIEGKVDRLSEPANRR